MLREKENNVEQENVSVLKELCATGPYLGQISRIFWVNQYWRIFDHFSPPWGTRGFPNQKNFLSLSVDFPTSNELIFLNVRKLFLRLFFYKFC